MNANQAQTRERFSYNDFISHTLQLSGHGKCGASEWPYDVTLTSKPCFMGGGQDKFAPCGIC